MKVKESDVREIIESPLGKEWISNEDKTIFLYKNDLDLSVKMEISELREDDL